MLRSVLNRSSIQDVKTFVNVLRKHPGIRSMQFHELDVDDQRINFMGSVYANRFSAFSDRCNHSPHSHSFAD